MRINWIEHENYSLGRQGVWEESFHVIYILKGTKGSIYLCRDDSENLDPERSGILLVEKAFKTEDEAKKELPKLLKRKLKDIIRIINH